MLLTEFQKNKNWQHSVTALLVLKGNTAYAGSHTHPDQLQYVNHSCGQ